MILLQRLDCQIPQHRKPRVQAKAGKQFFYPWSHKHSNEPTNMLRFFHIIKTETKVYFWEIAAQNDILKFEKTSLNSSGRNLC